MVGIVTAAGGVSVVAHPWGRHERSSLDEAALAELAGARAGRDRGGPPGPRRREPRATLRAIARNLGLVATGSSDHHGAGKSDHELGCNTTDPDEFARLLALADAAAARSGRRTPEVVEPMSDLVNTVLLVEVFVTLFVIMDPVGTVPIFLSLTSGRSASTARKAAWQAVAVSFFVITVFAFFGQQILEYLHISLPALQGAGGLLLLLVALELLTDNEKEPTATAGTNVALVPLGTPLLAGPGAIVATMLFVRVGRRRRRLHRRRARRGPRARQPVGGDALLAADPAR